MSNLEKLNNIFCEVFEVEASALNEQFNKDTVEQWDSIHQFTLVTNIEDAYDLMLSNRDILSLTSYKQAIEVVRDNGVEI